MKGSIRVSGVLPETSVKLAVMKTLQCAFCLVVLILCCSCVPAEAPQTATPTTQSELALIEIPNARQPIPGVLAGGQPTREQFEDLAKVGYRTVVNLRSLAEEGAWDEADQVEGLGMAFLHLPIQGPEDLSRQNTATLANVLNDPESYPVLIHCKSGNRVGALLALKAAWLDNATLDEAMQLGLEAGMTRLEPATRKLIAGDATSGQ